MPNSMLQIYQGRGESIFTEADDLAGLREQILEAVRCHFADADADARQGWTANYFGL